MVLQTRIFFWSTTFLKPEKKSEFAEPLLQPEKRWVYSISHLFSGQPLFLNQKKKFEFAEPLFSNLKKNPSVQNHFSRTTFLEFLEKWLQIKWLSASTKQL